MMNIFKEILRQLGKENNANKTLEQLVEATHKVLQGKRCLVVIDDIWTVNAWERLKPAFESIFTPAASSSSKMLHTTRNQGLLRHVDRSGYLHLLQPLSDDDSWKLLKRKAFIGLESTSGGESSTNSTQHNFSQNEPQDAAKMEELGREMLKHCKGLPIAIVALGGILSTRKTTSDWEDVKKNISSYLMDGIEQGGCEDDSQMLKVLELSYHDLPFYLKPCFLYLGNFPEDYKISTERLYHLWEAEGLLTMEGEAKKRGGTSYDIGERYLNELVQRSMVQVGEWWTSGRIKTCHVHDVMRDMCLIKCEEVSFLHHINCTASSSDRAFTMPVLSNEIKRLRRCALYDENGGWLYTRLKNGERDVGGLRSLLVFRKLGTFQRIWKAFPLLRVLDLERTDVDSIEGVDHLIHLRYLSLKSSRIKVLPSCLYDLKYLETLDLRFSPWATIKLRDEFYKMKRLRHLYLPNDFDVKGGGKLRFPSGGQMETIENFNPERCDTKELMHMRNLRVFSIRRYYVFKKAEEFKSVFEVPVMKKAGQLINDLHVRINLSDVIKETPTNGSGGTNDEESRAAHNSSLTLDKYQTIGDLLLALGILPTLQVLHLKGSPSGEAPIKMIFSNGSFPHLTKFLVAATERSFEWEVGEAAIPNLQVLELDKCENLNKLKNIPNSLTEVALWDCVITEEEVSALEELPHLKSLTIKGGLVVANKLLSFSAGSFPNLTQLNLGQQAEVEEWEVGEGALAHLQSLRLEGMGKWIRVMIKLPSLTNVALLNYTFREGEFSVLEKLLHLKSLCIEGELGNKLLSCSADSFPQLTELSLERQTELEEWEVGEGALANLQSLKLEGWNKLKKVTNKLPDSLTQVELKDCEIGEGDVSLFGCLEKLSRLQKLTIGEVVRSGGGNKLSFGPGTFLQLAELDLRWHPESDEWEVEDGALPNLQQLTLWNWKRLNKVNKLPNSLTRVDLINYEIGEVAEDVLFFALENLPRLQQLKLHTLMIRGKKMSFSPCSFLHLTTLSIISPNKLEKWEVGDGALPNLQYLKLWHCSKLKKLPDPGLPASVHIECYDPCIKGIEKYNTCPHFKKGAHVKSISGSKPMRWLHSSCA